MQMQILKYKCNQVTGQLVLTAASNQTHPSNLNLQLPWKNCIIINMSSTPKMFVFAFFGVVCCHFFSNFFVWRPSFIVELCPSLSRGTCCPTVTVTKVSKKLQHTYISTCWNKPWVAKTNFNRGDAIFSAPGRLPSPCRRNYVIVIFIFCEI